MKRTDAKITDAEWVKQRLEEEDREPLELEKGPLSSGDVDTLIEWAERKRGVFIHEEADGRTYFVPDPDIEDWSPADRLDYKRLNPKTDVLVFDRDEDGDVHRREHTYSYDPLA